MTIAWRYQNKPTESRKLSFNIENIKMKQKSFKDQVVLIFISLFTCRDKHCPDKDYTGSCKLLLEAKLFLYRYALTP